MKEQGAGAPAGAGDLRFRELTMGDKEAVLAIAAKIWDGEDYLDRVFDRWVSHPGAPFIGLFLNSQLVGCGRMLPFDRERAWLEGLRVDPAYQGRGLGRALARHTFALGRERGFRRLYFSTYFQNHASIRVAEEAGFQRIATFSFLEMKLENTPEKKEQKPEKKLSVRATAGDEAVEARWASDRPAGEDRDPSGTEVAVQVRPGLPEAQGFLSNDWLFVPADLPDLEHYFPRAVTIRVGECVCLLAGNRKDPENLIDICRIDGADGEDAGACIDAALDFARESGAGRIQVMLPERFPVLPFHQRGFASFEQAGDVFLFMGEVKRMVF